MFNYFYPAIYRFARSRINDKEAAQDIAQTVFLKVARTIKSFDITKGNFSTWIWQIARNTLTDHFRSTARNMADPETATNTLIDETASVEEADHLIKDDAGQILDIVKDFSAEDQELFRLKYIAEVSYEEIAEITGRSENALRVALHRIREKIRNEYDG
ncbi:sigma-70 family RNA polymerase sigma factor [Candidatus Parcubacteria bacterium]|nr:sigma-70 family RNA polymerase sigma factor [Candidatus Parcubacteria bacterium]